MLAGTRRAQELTNLCQASHVVHVPCEGRHLGDGDAGVRAGQTATALISAAERVASNTRIVPPTIG